MEQLCALTVHVPDPGHDAVRSSTSLLKLGYCYATFLVSVQKQMKIADSRIRSRWTLLVVFTSLPLGTQSCILLRSHAANAWTSFEPSHRAGCRSERSKQTRLRKPYIRALLAGGQVANLTTSFSANDNSKMVFVHSNMHCPQR